MYAPAEMVQMYAPVQSQERFVNQNSKMLKVLMGPDVLARTGAMVAYEGYIQFNYDHPDIGRYMQQWATGEQLPLMRCTGQGNLFLAQGGSDIVCFQLNNESICVNNTNVLAFDAHLQWSVDVVRGAAALASGGLFNIVIQGTGWVAITSHGPPIVLRAEQAPTWVDFDSIIAWSHSLQTTVKTSIGWKNLIGKGSGEAFQLGFQGQGYVIVEPYEPPPPPTAGQA